MMNKGFLRIPMRMKRLWVDDSIWISGSVWIILFKSKIFWANFLMVGVCALGTHINGNHLQSLEKYLAKTQGRENQISERKLGGRKNKKWQKRIQSLLPRTRNLVLSAI